MPVSKAVKTKAILLVVSAAMTVASVW
nr:unnamed protein product [Callosobruchus analis]